MCTFGIVILFEILIFIKEWSWYKVSLNLGYVALEFGIKWRMLKFFTSDLDLLLTFLPSISSPEVITLSFYIDLILEFSIN